MRLNEIWMKLSEANGSPKKTDSLFLKEQGLYTFACSQTINGSYSIHANVSKTIYERKNRSPWGSRSWKNR